MAYFIFLKYLRSLEEFRKNPHVKIPPKSPPTNCYSEKKLSSLSAHRPSSQPAHLAFRPSRGPFFLFNWPSPPCPLGLGLSAGPAHPLGLADRPSVAPCLMATSFMGKCLPSHRLCPSPCLADRWAPPVITFLPAPLPRRATGAGS
jgi:hypothetical protein